MVFPRVVFKQMPLELETEMFLGFLDQDWGNKITEKFPQFLKIKEIKSEKDRREIIKKEIVKIRQELGQNIIGGSLEIESDWRKVEENILLSLSKIIETDYSVNEITALISINPVCPRFLETWSFSVPPGHWSSNIIITHEISHFLFFKKLKEVCPEIKREKYESPHKEWILSEIVAVIILRDRRISQIIDTQKSNYYPKHREMILNGESLTKMIERLYEQFVIQNNDFSEFIRESIELLKDLK